MRERVKHHLVPVEDLFRQSLEAARDLGELSPDANPAAVAAFIMTSIWGLRVLMAAGTEPHRARTVVEQLMHLLK